MSNTQRNNSIVRLYVSKFSKGIAVLSLRVSYGGYLLPESSHLFLEL